MMTRQDSIRGISLLLIMLLFSCKQDEVKRSYPVVSTEAVTNISSQGAHFSASFTNAVPDDIIDCGFVWGEGPNLNLDNSLHIKLGKPESQVFSADATSSLLPKIQYQLRPYVRTQDVTVYGKSVTFISLGSSAPLIEDYTPKKGSQGDTLIIKGKYFGQNLRETKVIFESTTNRPAVSVTPSKMNETQIKVAIPKDLTEHLTIIKVQVLGNTTKATGNFELIQPLITSLGSVVAHYFDSITINYQSNGFQLTAVAVNGKELPAIITPQFVRFAQRVPTDPMTVRISSNSLYDEKVFSNFVERPVIASGLPANITSGDTLHLVWSYPLPTSFQVYTGPYNQVLTIRNKTNTGMDVIIPSCMRGTNNLTFIATDFAIVSQPYNINPPKMISVNPAQAAPGELIAIIGTDFYADKANSLVTIGNTPATIISITKNQIKAIMPAIPLDYISPSPGRANISFSPCSAVEPPSISVGIKAPVINSISPTTITSSLQTVTINGDNFVPSPNHAFNEVSIKGFTGSVISATKNQISASLIYFDPSVTTYLQGPVSVRVVDQKTEGPVITVDYHGVWTPLAPSPIHGTAGIAIGLNNKGYVGLDDRGANLNQFSEYDPATDTWTQLADFPGQFRFRPVCFTALGKLYVGLGFDLNINKYFNDFWEFNPSTKQWTQVADLPGQGRYYAAAFSSSGLGFAGGGIDKNGNALHDFYEFNPSIGTWTQLSDIPLSYSWEFVTFNNKGYVYNQIISTRTGAIFDIATKQWTADNNVPFMRLSNYPQLMPLSTKTILGNISYNPESKVSTPLTGPYSTLAGIAAFSINGIGYVIFQDPSNGAVLFASYDPTK